MEFKPFEGRPIMNSKTHQLNKDGEFERQAQQDDLSKEKYVHICKDCISEFYNFV